MELGVKSRIVNAGKSLTLNENCIAKYVVDHFGEIPEETVTTLAEKTKTSESAIVRFCRKIGFSGFYKLKVTIAQELTRENENLSIPFTLKDSTFKEVAVGYRNLIDDMCTLVNELELEKVVGLLTESRNVHLICSSSFCAVGIDFESRLNSVGINAVNLTDRNRMVYSSLQSTKDDVCVFIVRNIEESVYANILRTYQTNGAKIVLFTQHYSKKNHDYADAVVVIADKIVEKNSALLSDNIMMMLATDAVMNMVLRSDEKYLKMYNKCHALSTGEENRLETVFYSP